MQSNQRILYEKTRITMWMTALHSGQLAPSPLCDEHNFHKILRGCIAPTTKAKPSIVAGKQTSQQVLVRMQHLAIVGCWNQSANFQSVIFQYVIVQSCNVHLNITTS